MVDSSSLVGSGAKSSPSAAADRLISPTSAPGPTTIAFAFVSTGDIALRERKDRSIPLSVIDAPVVLV
jgi:hypothetical protein